MNHECITFPMELMHDQNVCGAWVRAVVTNKVYRRYNLQQTCGTRDLNVYSYSYKPTIPMV